MLWPMVVEACQVLRANPLRSALTMLGIMVGVGSVVLMMAVVSGASAEVQNQLRALGTNLIFVYSMNARAGPADNGPPAATLSASDAQALAALPGVVRVASSSFSSARAAYAAKTWDTKVYSTTPEYLLIHHWSIEAGEGFSQIDTRIGRPVLLLGQTVARKLFGAASAIGKTVLIGRQPFRVKGILRSNGVLGGVDQDDVIILPLRSAQQRLFAGAQRTHAQAIDVELESATLIATSQREIDRVLRERHGKGDFGIANASALSSSLNAANLGRSLMLGAIGSVSLLVGGIGIMNVMLVSVTERTREIGLRLALGATRWAIVVQFLTESTLLALCGCVVGVVLGVGAALVLDAVTTSGTIVGPTSVLISVAVAAAVGVFFGWYPARRASQLNPIEALRFH